MKINVGASISVPVVEDRRTINGAEVDVGITEGDRSVDIVGSGKFDPPTC